MEFEIPEYVKRVLDALTDAGFESYLVGGCVRDAALGQVPHDYDATTSALPEEMLRVFEGFRVIETGLKHGTLTVMSDGEPVEVTTYRVDGEYLDNRHPAEVCFTGNITDDLSRRDFTVNAMAYSPVAGLCDPFGGMEHLRQRRLVTVGLPEERFCEDGLRILRALRFSSVLDFEIDPATAEAVVKLAPLLDNISRERVFTELKKLICGKGAAGIMDTYGEVLSRCVAGTNRGSFEGAHEISALPADPVVRLAYIFRRSPAGASGALAGMRGLKASTAEARRCSRLAEEASKPYPASDKEFYALMGRMDAGDAAAYGALHLAETGDATAHQAFWSRYLCLAATNPCVRIADLAVNGGDVMALTGASGARVGRHLESLLDAVMSGEVRNEREALLSRLRTSENF